MRRKKCRWCGDLFGRKRLTTGRLEKPDDYAKRRWCSRPCAWAERSENHRELRAAENQEAGR